MLDLRAIHLGQNNIASFARKSEAQNFAKSRGMYARDILKAYNRFCIFWIVADYTGEAWRVLTRDGGAVQVTIP